MDKINVTSQLWNIRLVGVDIKVNHAAIMTPEEGNQIWDSGAVGVFNPEVLLHCVFFYVGKYFCLRGSPELREPKPLSAAANLHSERDHAI